MSVFEPAGDAGADSAPSGTNAAAEAPSSPANEPTPIELSDDALIRIKGSDKPVKFSDHVKGFQSQFTKASQRAANAERLLAERDAKLRALEQAQNQARSAPQAASEDVFASLRQLPYLSGEDAVGVVQSIGEQLRQRDMVLMGTLKQLQSMKQLVDQLSSTHSAQSFESKINNFLSQGGYVPEYADYAKELYNAYEGDDLDQEFPQILSSRLEQLEKLIDAKRTAKVAAARRQPFIPGKGGNANPSKPLQVKADASAREIADELWESLSHSGT
jgi:hypothetical protein